MVKGKMMGRIRSYIEVLKPRETSLLIFISLCAAVVAAGDTISPGQLAFAMLTVSLGCAGVNGLTNYLDRDVDARMLRTKHRSLPSKRIDPPEKALLLTSALTAISLGLAWLLHPLCFAAGLLGILAAITRRKTVVCPFFGAVASCSPVAVAWFAFRPEFDLPLLFLCLLICIWVPIHVWSVMIAHRDDYVGGGVRYFPLSKETREAVQFLFLLSLPLVAISIAVFFSSDLGWLYLAVAALLGVLMFYANSRLIITRASYEAWRVYKLSAFPYLGLLFLAMGLDSWLL
jgi:protoheme IX farnesyltransferase